MRIWRRTLSTTLLLTALAAVIVGAVSAPANAATAKPMSLAQAIKAQEISRTGHAVAATDCSLIAFQSTANSRYVSAELGYTGGNYAMLRARATSIGPWEKFDINCFVATCTIKSLANGLYVSAELDYTGGNYAMLRARASSPGPWETFR